MKKIVALFVSVFVLSTSLMCGCEKKDDSNSKRKDKDRDDETEEVETEEEEEEEEEETKETAATEKSEGGEGTVPESEKPSEETSASAGPSGHIFENGKCTDCDMLWTEYLYDAIGEVTGNTGDGYHTFLLEDCDLFLSSGDTVKYNLANKDDTFIIYTHTCDENSKITLSLTDNNEELYKNHTYTVLSISYRYSRFNDDDVVPLYRFNYDLTIFIDPGKYSEVFGSKEYFEKVCNSETDIVVFLGPSLEINNEDNYPMGIKAWDEMTDDEIKALFDEYGVTYMSRDEFIDQVWEDHDNYFGSIDYGLEQMNTSLADDGINWK